MGDLADAIRDHLELKRQRGMSDEEIAVLETEALGPVRRRSAPVVDVAEDGEPAPVEETGYTDDLDPVPVRRFKSNGAWEEGRGVSDDSGEYGEYDDDPMAQTPEFLRDRPEDEQAWRDEDRRAREYGFDD
jgi:hypothetical protein